MRSIGVGAVSKSRSVPSIMMDNDGGRLGYGAKIGSLRLFQGGEGGVTAQNGCRPTSRVIDPNPVIDMVLR